MAAGSQQNRAGHEFCNCSRFTGQWFKNIEDIPEQVNCFNCGEDIENPLKHAVVIYRVL